MHKHKYKVTTATRVSVYDWDARGEPSRIDTEFVMFCTKCGKPKKNKVRGIDMTTEAREAYTHGKGWTY